MPVTVGIAGATGSGKTTLCSLLEQFLKNKNVSHKTFHLDEFYKADSGSMLSEAEVFNGTINWETPDKIDFDAFIKTVDTERSSDVDFILVEGFLLLADQRLIEIMDFIVFINVDKHVVKHRRFNREQLDDETHKNNFETYFETCIWPSYQTYTLHVSEKMKSEQSAKLIWLDGALAQEKLLHDVLRHLNL